MGLDRVRRLEIMGKLYPGLSAHDRRADQRQPFYGARVADPAHIALGSGCAWFTEPGVFADHLAGMVVGGAIGVALDILDRRLKGRLGFGGDADKLLATAGAWLAWQGLRTLWQ